jgi:hypothetical protein
MFYVCLVHGSFQALGGNIKSIMMIINSTVFSRDIASAVLFLLHNIIIDAKPSTTKTAITTGSETIAKVCDV